MVLLQVQELSARQFLPSKVRCVGLFKCRHGGKRLNDGQDAKGMGR